MPKPAALIALLYVLAACSSDPKENPQRNEASGVERATSTPLPEDQTAPVAAPTTDDVTPADSNTTMPAATLEEAAPPPEP